MSLVPRPDPISLQPQSWWRNNRGKVIGGVAAFVGTVAGGLVASTCSTWPPWAQFLCPVAASAIARAPIYFANDAKPAHEWARAPVCSSACALEGPTYGMPEVDGGYCWCAGQ